MALKEYLHVTKVQAEKVLTAEGADQETYLSVGEFDDPQKTAKLGLTQAYRVVQEDGSSNFMSKDQFEEVYQERYQLPQEAVGRQERRSSISDSSRRRYVRGSNPVVDKVKDLCTANSQDLVGIVRPSSLEDAAENGDVLIEEDEAENLLGFAYIKSQRRDGKILVRELLVNPPYRSKGVGTKLLNQVKALGKGIHLRASNDESEGFLTKNGFRYVGTEDGDGQVLLAYDWTPERVKGGNSEVTHKVL